MLFGAREVFVVILTNNATLLVIDFQVRLMPSIHDHEKLADKVEKFIIAIN